MPVRSRSPAPTWRPCWAGTMQGYSGQMAARECLWAPSDDRDWPFAIPRHFHARGHPQGGPVARRSRPWGQASPSAPVDAGQVVDRHQL